MVSITRLNTQGRRLFLETFLIRIFNLLQNQLAYLTHHLDSEGHLQQQPQRLSQLQQSTYCTHHEVAPTPFPKTGSDGGLLASLSAANDEGTTLAIGGHDRRSKSKRKVCEYS